MISESHANYDVLEQHWDELLDGHEGQWVACHGGDFVYGFTIEDVLAEAGKRGWPLSTIAIDQLLRERASVLL
ncbi:MAG: hypothetical protein EPO22_01490 [Dehalococcoidia bacterium]|nr:MAG: hypothetical protein EPO22_01490 [Dehalococcoidia bacterium]